MIGAPEYYLAQLFVVSVIMLVLCPDPTHCRVGSGDLHYVAGRPARGQYGLAAILFMHLYPWFQSALFVQIALQLN